MNPPEKKIFVTPNFSAFNAAICARLFAINNNKLFKASCFL